MKTLFFVATALVFVGITASVFADTDRILDDFSSILEKEPQNLIALEGKAGILAELDCNSYSDCPPLEALHIYEKMLMISPENKEWEMKRNSMFMEVGTFDYRKTNGEYIVNVQQIVRDKNGVLVSVIENAGANILPTAFTEKYLDEREKFSTEYNKDRVTIGQDEYIRWYFVTEMSTSEKERKFFGKNVMREDIPDAVIKETPGFAPSMVDIRIAVMYSLFPAINVDEGDSVLKITQVLKRV